MKRTEKLTGGLGLASLPLGGLEGVASAGLGGHAELVLQRVAHNAGSNLRVRQEAGRKERKKIEKLEN